MIENQSDFHHRYRAHIVVTNGTRVSVIPDYFDRAPIDLANRAVIRRAVFPTHAVKHLEESGLVAGHSTNDPKK
jgi:hypothetical protein